MRNIQVLRFGATYTRSFTVVYWRIVCVTRPQCVNGIEIFKCPSAVVSGKLLSITMVARTVVQNTSLLLLLYFSDDNVVYILSNLKLSHSDSYFAEVCFVGLVNNRSSLIIVWGDGLALNVQRDHLNHWWTFSDTYMRILASMFQPSLNRAVEYKPCNDHTNYWYEWLRTGKPRCFAIPS